MIEQSNKIQLKATYIYLMIWAKNTVLQLNGPRFYSAQMVFH